MGSKHFKHSDISRGPCHNIADRAATRINTQYSNGLDAHRIAATVPDGKDPLVIMFKKDEEEKYAYDQEYYDGFQGHRPRRPNGEWEMERDRQRALARREGREIACEGEQHGKQRVSIGLRTFQGSDRGYAPAAERETGGPPYAQVNAAREPGGRLGEHEEGRDGARRRSAKGGVSVTEPGRLSYIVSIEGFVSTYGTSSFEFHRRLEKESHVHL